MKIDTAALAGSLAAQIAALQASMTLVNLVIAENWPVTVLNATAPAQGSSQPAGTVVSLLPNGVASPQSWKAAVTAAQTALQAQLDALNAQLAAL